MVLRVVEKAKQAKSLQDVVVLTDDERILNVVLGAGHKAVMTSTQCASGTDRIAEYMQNDSTTDVFVNLQGDEILLNPDNINQLVEEFIGTSNPEMGTLAHWVTDQEKMIDPTTAKIVTDQKNNALYFSRNCIPVTQAGELPEKALVQIGVYIYTRDTLQKLMKLEQTPLETIEKLEQLRALENSININITVVDDYETLSVDTEADLVKARALFV